MTSRNIINSDFYQIVNVDQYDNPLSIKSQYLNVANLTQGSNITLANTAGNWTISANVQYSNSNVQAYLPTYTGNIGAAGSTGYIFGNGSQLTNLPIGNYSNSNVQAYLPTYTGNLISLTGNVTTTANISAGYYLGNGSQLTGIQGNYSNANVQGYLPIYAGNLGTGTGYLFGNGAFLSGLSASYSNSNVASYLPTYTGNIANVAVTRLREPITVNSGTSSAITIPLNGNGIYFNSSAIAGAVTVNFTTTGTQLAGATYLVTSATVILTNSATGGVITTLQIDNVNQTVHWLGGAPTANTSGYDIYAFNFFEYASPGSWIVFGSRATTT
jgi:hypothetical protein